MSISVALDHVHEDGARVYVRAESMGTCDVCGLDSETAGFVVRDIDVAYYVYENDYDATRTGERIAFCCAHVECWKMACAAKVAT